VGRALTWSGRHSLGIYLLHQPVLYGFTWLLAAVVITPTPPPGAVFRAECIEACQARGGSAARCTATCACTMDQLIGTKLWAGVVINSMTPEEEAEAGAIFRRCEAEVPPER
jgi:uncharacterized membrane protein